ncbi:hypothetical protein EYR40_008483 [Pleurotus pulmonarius]|nr:hypothetical protein EYR36_009301 [Pleurotus pulmonarius]KAF4592800.1 hypothetical protein EYR38_008502 [Pleurotus pulmonarius]KAF4593693.1 hypothetical protein EYR40_008483 [Pleurotus pulmonarius]
MISHRRAPAAHNRKFARVPAGIRLHPRFSPTAIYPGMTETDPEPTPTSTPPSVTPPSTPTTTSGPVTTPNPVNPPQRSVTTTPAVDRPVTPVVSTTTTTPPTVVVQTVLPTTTEGPANTVLTTPTATTPLTSAVAATPLLNGGTTTSLLTPLSTLSRNVAPALGTSSSSAAISSSSATPDSGSSSSTGAIVGGIGAGLVGVALVVFGVFYAVRRWRKRSDENAFDPDSFRRSAVLMNDPPTHEDTVSRGYNPRPPSMIERKLANSTPVNTGYGGPQAGYGATGYNSYGSFAPGEVMSPPPTSGSPDYHYSNNVASYNAVSPYAQSPFTPASPGSPHVAPYDSAYSHVAGVGAAGALNRQLSTGPVHVEHLSRAPSYGPDDRQGHASLTTVGSVPQGDYVDLTRSSVSPYQATQYAEISKQLNTAVPAGLSTPAVNQYMGAVAAAEPSPFADPDPSRFSRALPSPYDQPTPSPSSDLEFPAPPTPAAVQHARVDSIPPSLPEIHVQARVSGYDDFNGQKDRFPTTPVPSPLASSLTFEAPSAAAAPAQAQPASVSAGPKAPQGAPAPAQRAPAPATERPATVYDEGDAYGGF